MTNHTAPSPAVRWRYKRKTKTRAADWGHAVQARTHQQNQNRERHARDRHAVARDFRDRRRQLTSCQRKAYAHCAIHIPAVTAGERRRQHDKVDNASRGGDADFRGR